MKKKHLGQHFLHDVSLLRKIANESPAQSGDWVLEIGPGEGSLTRAILEKGCNVIAVEYDAELIPVLESTFSEYISAGTLVVVQGDFLKQDIQTLLSKPLEPVTDFHVIANIPYYITGAIMRSLFSGSVLPKSISLIMQKEVAERIVKKDDKHSLLSLSVWAYGNPKLAFKISAGAFNPPPKVDSALLVITNISRENFNSLEHEEQFFKILHEGFGQKRKQLRNLITTISTEQFAEWCQKSGYPLTIRAEDVSLSAWLDLSK